VNRKGKISRKTQGRAPILRLAAKWDPNRRPSLVFCYSCIDGLLFYDRMSPRAKSRGLLKTDSSTPLRSARNDGPSNHE
jgi:hypothetical protein